MNKKKTLLLGMCLYLPALTHALTADPAHTLHKVVATKANWKGRLVIATPYENAYFVTDAQDRGQVYDFHLSSNQPLNYGFAFRPGTDFNVSYTVTLVQDAAEANFVNKACVFNVSAKGPANPDIRVQAFNGAECNFKVVEGVGENFTVG